MERPDLTWLGRTVTVTVDRPMGTYHPGHAGLYYPVNYGYVQGVAASDGEEQDAYILGVDAPLRTFTGVVAAVIHRRDDAEDKWVVAPPGLRLTAEEIRAQTRFQERFFEAQVIL